MFSHDTIHEGLFRRNYVINIIRILQWPKRYLYDIDTSNDMEKVARINYCWWFCWLNLIITWLLHLKLKQCTHFFTTIRIKKMIKLTRDDEWRKPYIWHDICLLRLIISSIKDLYRIQILGSTQRTCIDCYLWDWKVTSRQPKFRHIEFVEKRSQISWNALGFAGDLNLFSRKTKFRDNRAWDKEIHLYVKNDISDLTVFKVSKGQELPTLSGAHEFTPGF